MNASTEWSLYCIASDILWTFSSIPGKLKRKTTGKTIALVKPWCVLYSAPTTWDIECTLPNPFRNDIPAKQDPTCIPPLAKILSGCSTAVTSDLDINDRPSNAAPSHRGLNPGTQYPSIPWINASTPVHAVRLAGSPIVNSGSINANEGLTSGCHMQNFIPSFK